jgi:hypothetical protein
MREGTTSRVMAADRPYGEFHDFYSISLEYFGYHHVHLHVLREERVRMAVAKLQYGTIAELFWTRE